MAEAKGCPTRRKQGQGITIIETTITIGIITIIIELTITIYFHCCATMTPGHAG
jgi:hypothetical protein